MVLLALIGCKLAPPGDVTLDVVLANVSEPGALVASDDSAHDVKFGPAALIVHHPLITPVALAGAASAELEALAEDGDPSALVASLEEGEGIATVVVFAREDEETYEAAALLPGQEIQARFTAPYDAVVTVLFMFGESNDVFYANATPVALWVDEAGENAGDHTAAFTLWDAGTELNQEPGLGADQAPRQAAPDTGADEGGEITPIDGTDAEGFAYPEVASAVALALELPPQAD